jgi:hypothetical protein
VTPSGGTQPYSYLWNDPGSTTDSTVTSLIANTVYQVTVTDDNGCIKEINLKLSEPDPITIQADYTDTICPYSNTGIIDLTVSGGTQPYSYFWSSGQETEDISYLFTGEYVITITDSNNCQEVASYHISEASPFEGEEICIVSADQQTGNNVIIWEKTPNVGIDYYKVYRESKIIGTVGVNELSVFEDTIADPETRPYLYYISVVDTCGNESGLSHYHKPLFLQYVSSDRGVILGWDEYQIGDGQINFESYTLFRGTDSLALSPLEDSIPTQITVYTDKDPSACEQKYYYRIAGVLVDACEPTGSKKAGNEDYRYAMSNLEENRIESGVSAFKSKELNIYPNPFSNKTMIEFPNPEQEKYQFILTNLSGKIIRHEFNIIAGYYELDRNGISSGLYIVELQGRQIYRGMIVVE